MLCEKPLAANAAQAREMFAAFAASRVPLLEAFMYRRHPLTLRALALLRSGRLGRLRLARSAFTSTITDPNNIRFQPDLAGGGALRDLGCYCLDILRQAAGTEPIAASVHATP